MGHHGVVHVSQRPRRTETEMFLPVRDRTNGKGNNPTLGKGHHRARGQRRVPAAAAAEIALPNGPRRAWSTLVYLLLPIHVLH